jgi:ubiquinone/menaquinone biosynthesis C-methylase UbiE
MAENDWLREPQKGVHYLTPPKKEFEAAYIAVRTLEGRVLSDEAVMRLPASDFYPEEWQKRVDTLQRFSNYLDKQKPTHILEIGCGNGWFAHALTKKGREVYGLDVGALELEQAARCFPSDHLHFLCCTDWSLLPAHFFDVLVFNGSVQYFEMNAHFWNQVFRLLKPGGEVHLLDTFFYAPEEVEAAKKRSADYFSALGDVHSTAYYHHQSWDLLPKNYTVLYRPSRLKNLFRKTHSPFPWIRVQSVL